jgi:hypothetical protein
LKVVELRNVFTSCNDTLIEIKDDFIYYAEEKKEEGHNNLFILEYNRDTKRERILSNYFLKSTNYIKHFFSFQGEILIIMESGESEVTVLSIDKHTGEEKNTAKLSFIGNMSQCCALDRSHLIIYTEQNEKHRSQFEEYEKLTGRDKIVYLFDLNDGAYYYLCDPRFSGEDGARFITYDKDGESQLLVLQPHKTEEDKAKAYEDRRWVGDNVNDNVWVCSLSAFIDSVKLGEECAPLELVLCAGTCGMVRYVGMNEKQIYFRAKYFPTNDQRLCSYNIHTGKKSVVTELNLEEDKEKLSQFYIDVNSSKAYSITTEVDEDYQVDGVWNSSVHSIYSRELGDFVACIDDRYIIARYVLSDDKDSFEFNSIYDIATGEQKSYECKCLVKGDTVVLY